MNAIERVKQRLRDAGSRESIMDSLKEVVRENLGEFADANVEQLMEGLNANGVVIGSYRPYKNPVYAAMKEEMNPKPKFGNPDMKLSGDFHEDIEAKLVGGGVKLHGNNWKTLKLERMFGPLLGLSMAKVKEISETVLKPYLRDKIKRKLK